MKYSKETRRAGLMLYASRRLACQRVEKLITDAGGNVTDFPDEVFDDFVNALAETKSCQEFGEVFVKHMEGKEI